MFLIEVCDFPRIVLILLNTSARLKEDRLSSEAHLADSGPKVVISLLCHGEVCIYLDWGTSMGWEYRVSQLCDLWS